MKPLKTNIISRFVDLHIFHISTAKFTLADFIFRYLRGYYDICEKIQKISHKN